MDRDAVAESLAPVLGPHPRALVLGSMPGRRSLAEAAYYAHPRNLFWPLMEELLGVDVSAAYPERLVALAGAGVALWDVLARCERPGSLDSAIVRASEVPNPVGALLQAHPSIRVVATNGGAARALLRRHVLPTLDDAVASRVRWLALPSTSPANASMTRAAKRQAWTALVGALGA